MCKIGGRYFPAFALCKPLSERLPAVCVASHVGGESAAACVCMDFCFRLGKFGAETCEILQAAFGESCLSRLSGIPVSKVDANPLKTTPAQAGRPPPTPRGLWHVCEKSFALTDV